MKDPNIFWILTDGTRHKRGKDRYGRLPVYYEFDKESITFRKTITSAPSTLMSLSSIMTGRFAAELYPHFKYINNLGLIYPNYIDVLKKAGYVVNSSIYNNSSGRRIFKDVLGSCVDVFPRETLSNGNDTYLEFEYLMKNRFKKDKPNLIYLHFGWFEDNDAAIRKIFAYLKKENLFDDSIIITSSDHGYVDYGRFHHLGWALQPRTHSYYVDEDSYRANLNIKIPKSLTRIKSKYIDVPVCLIDLFETLFDYLGLNYDCENRKSRSLKPLIETNDEKVKEEFRRRILRVDNRYSMQNYRKTMVLGCKAQPR